MPPKRYTCDDCGKTVAAPSQLLAHRRTHTGEKPFECEQCEYKCSEKSNLKSHIRFVHSKIRPHECTKCGAVFCTSSDLKRHHRTHTGERPFECEICGAVFGHKENLKSHKRIHSGEKPFECEQCGHKTNDKGKLNSHIRRMHDKKLTHECDDCGVVFCTTVELTIHRRMHTGEKPFACEKCEYRSTNNANLKRHIKTIHGSQQLTHECDVCAKKFKSTNHLYAHKHSTHGDRRYACELCEYTTRHKGSLTDHVARWHSNTRNFICTVCCAAFKTDSGLRQHSIVHSTVKPFKCDHDGCDKTFKTSPELRSHSAVHSTARPFKCDQDDCIKTFKTSDGLRLHKRGVHGKKNRK